MSAKTVEVGGHNYRIGNMGMFTQLHIAKRVTPIYLFLVNALQGETPETLAAMKAMAAGDKQQADQAAMAAVTVPLMKATSMMKDEDFDYVVNECLGVCERQQQNGNWAPVRNNGALMFDDLSPQDAIGLTVNVITEKLGSFFPFGEPQSPAAAPTGQ